jgi:hypothetical protein
MEPDTPPLSDLNIRVVTDGAARRDEMPQRPDDAVAQPPGDADPDGAPPPVALLKDSWGVDEARYARDRSDIDGGGRRRTVPVFMPDVEGRISARMAAMSAAREDIVGDERFIAHLHELCFGGSAPLHVRMYSVIDSHRPDEIDRMDATTIDGMFHARIVAVDAAMTSIRQRPDCDAQRLIEMMGASRAIIAMLTRLNDLLIDTIEAARVSAAALSGQLSSDANAEWRYMPTGSKDKMNAVQKLYAIAFDKAKRLGYARYKDGFMKRIITPEGMMTNAWDRVSTVQDFVYGLTNMPDGNVQFLATRGVNVMENVADLLKKTRDNEIPWLRPDRRVFAFRNGCYVSNEEMFVVSSRDSPPTMPDGTPCPTACRYHDTIVEREWMDCPDPMAIPTPLMDMIMDTQELGADVKRMYFAMLGRSIYDLGEVDNWQVFLFVKGAAETGKSTLLKFVASFYNTEDVGILSNNIEGTFGASMISDKFVVVGDDLGENFGLDQQLFQNMSSGNDVSLPVKNKQAIVIKWITQLLLSGNVLPDYKDNSGSFSRRLIIVHYSKPVRHVDPTIPERLKLEIGAAIIKCNRMYRNTVRRFESLLRHPTAPVTFWDAVPEEFRIQKANVMQCANPIMSFLHSGMLVYGPSLYVPRSVFIQQMAAHCSSHGIAKPKFQPSQYEGPFGILGLKYATHRQTKVYPRTPGGARLSDIWIEGCDVVTTDAISNATADAVKAAEEAQRAYVRSVADQRPQPSAGVGGARQQQPAAAAPPPPHTGVKRPAGQQQQQQQHPMFEPVQRRAAPRVPPLDSMDDGDDGGGRGQAPQKMPRLT